MACYIGVVMADAKAVRQDGEDGYNFEFVDGRKFWVPKGIVEQKFLRLEDPTKISRSEVVEFIGDDVRSETLENGKTTLVHARTLSGFDQVETSSCVDPANYDEQIGVECCMKRIEDTIWKCLGFVLQWGRNGLNRNGGKEE